MHDPDITALQPDVLTPAGFALLEIMEDAESQMRSDHIAQMVNGLTRAFDGLSSQ